MNKVLIVEDHPVYSLGVRLLVERHGYLVVGETNSGSEALELTRKHQPDLVILDIVGLEGRDGLQVMDSLERFAPAPKVLVLSTHNPISYSKRCMQAGAAGYVNKQQEVPELLSAIRAVLSGYSYFPKQALHSMRSSQGSSTESEMVSRLSGREMMVLQRLAQGRSNKEIAESMFLSNKTVSTYKTRLLLKLNAHSLVDLIELAQRNGLV